MPHDWSFVCGRRLQITRFVPRVVCLFQYCLGYRLWYFHAVEQTWRDVFFIEIQMYTCMCIMMKKYITRILHLQITFAHDELLGIKALKCEWYLRVIYFFIDVIYFYDLFLWTFQHVYITNNECWCNLSGIKCDNEVVFINWF